MNEQEAKAIVLEWLKPSKDFPEKPLDSIYRLTEHDFYNGLPKTVSAAYSILSVRSQYELLAEFAAWGLKEDAKG